MTSLAEPHGARSAQARSRALAGARHRLSRWLLTDVVQLATGPNAGAVVGGCDAAGRASYAYPEITGYYLRWLAWRSACGDENAPLAARAKAAERWLAHWLSSPGMPATRVYLGDAPSDWRNDAFFFFDAAMALRGLASVDRAGLASVDARVVEALAARLAAMIEPDGLFAAFMARPGGSQPPDRWSTRRGPFLAKPAAGVLEAAETFPGACDRLRPAAEATLDACIAQLAREPHDEVHPQLYALEGILGRRERCVPRVVAAMRASFDALVDATRRIGRVPEALSRPGAARQDVVAQLLRAGVLLGEHSPLDSDTGALLHELADALAGNVTDSGAIAFDPSAASTPHNTWVAMFAEQALAVMDPDRSGGAQAKLRTLLV